MEKINYGRIFHFFAKRIKVKNKLLGNSLLVLCFTMLSYTASAQVGSLLWEDNFNTLDTKTWTTDIGNGCDIGLCGWGNSELESYQSGNVYIGDVPGETGNKALVIEAKRETSGTNSFTSGKINSDKKMSIQYGMVEVRVRVPDLSQGLWPAAWLLGSARVGWPGRGEIDMMEMGFSKSERDYQLATTSTVNNYVGANAFFPTSSGSGSIAYDVNYNKPYVAATPLNDRFVKYRIYWEPTQIRYTVVDGATEYDLYENPFPIDANSAVTAAFTKPFYMLLNMAVGGSLTGVTTTSAITATLPAKMYVDYVRVYKWNGYGSVTLSDGTIAAETGTFGVYTDDTVSTNKLALGTDAQLYVFGETLVAATDSAYEGNNVLSFTSDASKGWFGAGITTLFGKNMSNYTANGSLKFKIKIPANVAFTIGVNDNYTNSADVIFPANTTKYGLVRNGEWGEVTIPIADFAGSIAFQDMSYMFRIGNSGTVPTSNFQLSIDDITWVDGNTLCDATVIYPYHIINSGVLEAGTTVAVTAGGAFTLSPQPISGGSWSWTGPNSYSSTSREITLSNVLTTAAGSYIATYTNSCGTKSTATFVVTVAASTAFVPDTSKTYYISNPYFNKRIGANGTEDPFSTAITTTGSTVEWKFSSAGEGAYFIDCVGGLTKPRLRTDNTIYTDMQETTSAGTWESWKISYASSGKYYLTTVGTSNNRLQLDSSGILKQMTTASAGSWEQFSFTEVPLTTTTACTTTAVNGDFTAQLTTDSLGSYLTFVPVKTSVGATTLILYYSTTATGTYPGYITSTNTPYKINVASGQTVHFYYTYSLSTGGESNSSNDKMAFVIGGCNSTSKIASDVLKSNLSVKIYPNPMKDEVTAEINKAEDYENALLINSVGQIVAQQKFNTQTSVTFDTSTLPLGLYFIEINGQLGVKTMKVIKN